MVTERDKEIIRQRIADVFRAYGLDPKPSGGVLKCLCPFHDDTKPSLQIAESPHYNWKCWVDGSRGDVFDFVGLMEKLDIEADFGRIAEIAAAKIGYQLAPLPAETRQTPDQKAERIRRRERTAWLIRAGEQVRYSLAMVLNGALIGNPKRELYLQETRRRSPSTMMEYLIGWTRPDAKIYLVANLRQVGCKWSDAEFASALAASGMFTLGSDGKLQLFFRDSYLYPSFGPEIEDLFSGEKRPSVITFRRKLPSDTDQTSDYQVRRLVEIDGIEIPTCTDGRRQALPVYNLRDISADVVFLVEGANDALAAKESLVERDGYGAVGICGSAGDDEEIRSEIVRARAGLVTILAFDSDSAGFKYAEDYLQAFLQAGASSSEVRMVAWWTLMDWEAEPPEYYKDLDEYLVAAGPEEMSARMDRVLEASLTPLDYLTSLYKYVGYETAAEKMKADRKKN